MNALVIGRVPCQAQAGSAAGHIAWSKQPQEISVFNESKVVIVCLWWGPPITDIKIMFKST